MGKSKLANAEHHRKQLDNAFNTGFSLSNINLFIASKNMLGPAEI